MASITRHIRWLNLSTSEPGKTALLTLIPTMLIIFHLIALRRPLQPGSTRTNSTKFRLLNTQFTGCNQLNLYSWHTTPAAPATALSWLNIAALAQSILQPQVQVGPSRRFRQTQNLLHIPLLAAFLSNHGQTGTIIPVITGTPFQGIGTISASHKITLASYSACFRFGSFPASDG
jgi:hypothetical protein